MHPPEDFNTGYKICKLQKALYIETSTAKMEQEIHGSFEKTRFNTTPNRKMYF